MEKITVIVTIFNEEKTIRSLLTALTAQTLQPDEVILVDGGSHDQTGQVVHQFVEEHPQFPIQFIEKKGNRSVGRNEAIRSAKNEFIAITDAGCIPHNDWLEKLSQKAHEITQQEFVVAGYYDAQSKTVLQEAMVPYVLVMPDKVNPQDFLPATRSMLMTKSAWQKVGGFDERLSDNEDHAFAHKLKNAGVKMTFTEKAKVTWIPRSNLLQFAWMIYRFARGDMYAEIFRPKVLLVFARYFAGFILLGFFLLLGFPVDYLMIVNVVGFVVYVIWAIRKNARYTPRGWYWLPILQFTADLAVMSGSTVGLLMKLGSTHRSSQP